MLLQITNQLKCTTHVSNPAANKNATNANANLTTIPSTNTSTNNQPAERTTHVSNQPAEMYYSC